MHSKYNGQEKKKALQIFRWEWIPRTTSIWVWLHRNEVPSRGVTPALIIIKAFIDSPLTIQYKFARLCLVTRQQRKHGGLFAPQLLKLESQANELNEGSMPSEINLLETSYQKVIGSPRFPLHLRRHYNCILVITKYEF